MKTKLLIILATLALLSSLFTINEADGALCERIVDGICVKFAIPIIAGLENDTGIIALENQTYYFETPNYTETAYVDPVQISFHDVVFTLFPSGFRGGLPIGCGGSYFWTDVLFSDNTRELLHVFGNSDSCITNSIPTMFSNHVNPHAALVFYDEKMKLLVSTNITNSTLQSEQDIEVNYVDFRNASGEIICVGNSSGGGFLQIPKCNSEYGLFLVQVLMIALPLVGIIVSIIIWRKRK